VRDRYRRDAVDVDRCGGHAIPTQRDTGRAMSQENVDLVRRTIGAFNSGDWDAWLEYMDEDIEWRAADAVIDAGDDVVVVTRIRGRGIASGAEVRSNSFAQVARVRDRKIRRWEIYDRAQDALEAAGLRE
jgi:ketosteroid isomerase-like protein